jgi:hypothetical protein
MERTTASLRCTYVRADQDDGSTTTAPGTKHGTLNTTSTPSVEHQRQSSPTSHTPTPSSTKQAPTSHLPSRQTITVVYLQLPCVSYPALPSFALPTPPAETRAGPITRRVDNSLAGCLFSGHGTAPEPKWSQPYSPNLCLLRSQPRRSQPCRSQPRRSR